MRDCRDRVGSCQPVLRSCFWVRLFCNALPGSLLDGVYEFVSQQALPVQAGRLIAVCAEYHMPPHRVCQGTDGGSGIGGDAVGMNLHVAQIVSQT